MLINYGLLPTLCELGSGRTFAEAASRLRLTPSAISHQMRALEAQLGFRLFERVGRRAKLTPEAQRLVAVVAQHLSPIDEALEALLDDGKTVRGGVRIGGVLPFSRLWLRPRMAKLLKRHPELQLSVSFGAPSVLVPKLQSGLLDLAIVAEEVESPLLAARCIFVEEFWAVCSERYLAGAAPPTSARELERQRYIVYDDSRPMHEAWWRSVAGRRAAPAPTVACSIANLDEMLHLVEQGFGVAVLPNYLVADLVGRGKLLRLGARKPAPQSAVRLVWRKSSIETARFKVVRAALLAATSRQASAATAPQDS
jgi:DNA-binding transcriptional LysR family regulator